MDVCKRFAGRHPLLVSLVLTGVGYVLVIGTLYFDFLRFLYPSLTRGQVNLLSHAIALVNTITIVLLILGWYWIRRGDVRKHPVCMTAAFGLILLFLVLYLLKAGGGGRKEFVGPYLPKTLYLVMLGVHILLSIASVPLVLYTLLLGWTRSLDEIPSSPHANAGFYAAGAWIISLVLGVLAYVLLNHVYAFEFVPG